MRFATVLVFTSIAVPCSAQCLEWQTNVGHGGLGDGTINALAVYDEGSGARLFAGGQFDIAGSPFSVARWDGASWVGIANFTGNYMNSLYVFDDGIQPVLVASGELVTSGATPSRHIAAWDGTTWKGLGTGLNGVALAMCTFDDGTGPALYAAGNFTEAGGVNAVGIAKWDGTNWSSNGSAGPEGGLIYALCVFDDGAGRALYAGGGFHHIAGVAANRVARLRGSSWSAVGTNLNNGPVKCLTVHNGALYAGGNFEILGGLPSEGIAKWEGATWKRLGSGAYGGVSTLASWNDGSGAKLVAGGGFMAAGGAYYAFHVATWNGTQWKRLRTGIGTPPPNFADVYAALPFDEGLGHGSELFVAGRFSSVDCAATHSIARYGPCTPVGQTFCFGDGSLPTPCPCAPPDTVPHPSGGSDGGCANSFYTSGAKLLASGTTNPDTARLLVSDVFKNEFAFTEFGLFISGNANDAAGVASGDGVRCAGGAFVRFGSQNSIHGFFRYPNDPAGWSLSLSQVSSVTPGSGAVRHYQFLYRNAAPGFCNPSTSNWTNAVTLIW